MSIKIGHASKDEKGKFIGGAAGDQTGKEVCTRSWYKGGWDFVARPKSAATAEKMAAACEAGCANENAGYDMGGRNTGLQEAKKVNWDLSKITTPCGFDCSTLMTACVMAGGVNIWSGGNAPTTRTLRKVLEKSGEFEILTDSKYLTSDNYLQRGDILCKENSHTVMALENGSAAGTEAVTPKTDTVTVYYSVRLPLLKKGSEGPAVENLQRLLKGHGYALGSFGPEGDGVDGKFGTATEEALEAFQEDNKDTEGKELEVDGECGPKSWAALITK